MSDFYISPSCSQLQEDKGTKLIIGNGVKGFLGEDGKLVGVVLRTGETLEADVCLVGIGSVPTSEWLADSGLNITARGEVVVDKVGRENREVCENKQLFEQEAEQKGFLSEQGLTLVGDFVIIKSILSSSSSSLPTTLHPLPSFLPPPLPSPPLPSPVHEGR